MMATLEKRIDYVAVGVKALRARWRVVRPLLMEVADTFPEGSETRAQYLRDVKVMGKWVHGVRRAKFDPSLEVFQTSLATAEASLEQGFGDLEILETGARVVLARTGDCDGASERDPITTASEPNRTAEQDAEDREIYERCFPPQCSLCDRVAADLVSWDSEIVVAFHDEDPVSPGHVVITSRCHEPDIFALPGAAWQQMWAIVREVQVEIAEKHAPHGWQVLVNSGRVGGQSVEHAHIHVIPCYDGDPADPRGEVAGRLPGAARYAGTG
jgi:diadenosine tetraphosphate (Ap4A) HIT family hydrolase